jgi:hypothetical protein
MAELHDSRAAAIKFKYRYAMNCHLYFIILLFSEKVTRDISVMKDLEASYSKHLLTGVGRRILQKTRRGPRHRRRSGQKAGEVLEEQKDIKY